jgi:hypothetical protein
VQAATWLRGTRTVRVSTADSGADEAATRHQAGFCITDGLFCFLLPPGYGIFEQGPVTYLLFETKRTKFVCLALIFVLIDIKPLLIITYQ